MPAESRNYNQSTVNHGIEISYFYVGTEPLSSRNKCSASCFVIRIKATMCDKWVLDYDSSNPRQCIIMFIRNDMSRNGNDEAKGMLLTKAGPGRPRLNT